MALARDGADTAKMADDEPATLMKLAVAGLRKRLSNKEFGYTPPASEHRVYVDRLKYEMETLTRPILRLFPDGSRSDES